MNHRTLPFVHILAEGRALLSDRVILEDGGSYLESVPTTSLSLQL